MSAATGSPFVSLLPEVHSGNIPEMAETVPGIFISEVKQAINDTAKDKAAGPDNLDINIIKLAGDPLAKELTKLYNICLVQ